ncbi:MAG: ATP-dependent 6-phosphofructokinase [Alphaproteobacteria bacterium]|nr:ATP-dependent 6-phosphofructokinase [Alphaproteobacteria bacterium]
MKKIGILTSGGDCAGLNAVIRAISIRAIQKYGWEVYGIHQGTHGLMRRPVDAIKLDLSFCTGSLLRQGGTVLGTTNKGNPFAYPLPNGEVKDISEDLIEGYRLLKLDALIGIGGDGSQEILRRLSQQGNLNLVTIPKTIDDDLSHTEHSIGFMTAVNVATEAIDRLQPTAASHDRVMILEVMGRDAGHIGLVAGIAGGADVILIPEIPYQIEKVAQKIKYLQEGGRNFALVVVSEAVKTEAGEKAKITDFEGRTRYGGISHYLANRITELTGAETRFTVLGHVQRGGQPIFQDRVLASIFGIHAVDLIAQGKFDRMVAWQNRQVVDVSIQQAIEGYQAVDITGPLVKTARGLGISFGDDDF